MPEPFIGNVNSPIYLLNLNPGYNEQDLDWHSQNEFNLSIRANLLHNLSKYPFYFLNPAFKSSPGSEWWLKKLNKLICDTSLKLVAKNIFCVEYFPYHSKSYKDIPKRISLRLLASQKYSIYLVKKAMKKQRKIIIMRSTKKWINAIPELKNYYNKTELRSPQNVCITPNNLNNNEYNNCIKILQNTN